MRFAVLLVLMAAHGWSQAPAGGAGVDSEWDLRKLVDTLNAEAKRLRPMLQQADPKTWNDASAAQSYGTQWKGAQNELQYLEQTAAAFSKEPERLTLALETFFRLESVERSLASYVSGMRKYGNPAMADLLEGTVRENSDNREHLRQYISELAQTKEQEFKIADQEAQRCRNIISKQPPPPPAKKK